MTTSLVADAVQDTTPKRANLVARLKRLKDAQNRSGAAFGERQSEKRRQERQAEAAEELAPGSELARQMDNLMRLLFPLVRQCGWTKEDVKIVRSVRTVADAVAMSKTLEQAIAREYLRAPTPEEWLAMRVQKEDERKESERQRLREEAQARAAAVLDNMIQGLPVLAEDKPWVASMLEIIPEADRARVRAGWLERFGDTSITLESDRIREANQFLLAQAQEADLNRFESAQKENRKHIKAR